MSGTPDANRSGACERGAVLHSPELPPMTTHTHTASTVAMPRAARHLTWFALATLVAFLIPYLGLSVLDLQHDVFYLLYFCVTLALLSAYVHVERIDVRDTFTRHYVWSVGIGIATA